MFDPPPPSEVNFRIFGRKENFPTDGNFPDRRKMFEWAEHFRTEGKFLVGRKIFGVQISDRQQIFGLTDGRKNFGRTGELNPKS